MLLSETEMASSLEMEYLFVRVCIDNSSIKYIYIYIYVIFLCLVNAIYGKVLLVKNGCKADVGLPKAADSKTAFKELKVQCLLIDTCMLLSV